MGRLFVAMLLCVLSLVVHHFSWTYPFLWFVGVAPVDFADGCTLAAAVLFLWTLVYPYRIKVFE